MKTQMEIIKLKNITAEKNTLDGMNSRLDTDWIQQERISKLQKLPKLKHTGKKELGLVTYGPASSSPTSVQLESKQEEKAGQKKYFPYFFPN